MVNLEIGDKVSWIDPMMVVPHPEGKTDRDGVVLPVLRATERTGIIVDDGQIAVVRPINGSTPPTRMPNYYDKSIERNKLTKL